MGSMRFFLTFQGKLLINCQLHLELHQCWEASHLHVYYTVKHIVDSCILGRCGAESGKCCGVSVPVKWSWKQKWMLLKYTLHSWLNSYSVRFAPISDNISDQVVKPQHETRLTHSVIAFRRLLCVFYAGVARAIPNIQLCPAAELYSLLTHCVCTSEIT